MLKFKASYFLLEDGFVAKDNLFGLEVRASSYNDARALLLEAVREALDGLLPEPGEVVAPEGVVDASAEDVSVSVNYG